MEHPDKRITDFISKHHVLTLATQRNNKVWCANCFYAYRKEDQALIFTSDIETKHIKDIIVNKSVAASIVLETKVIGKIQGIQIEGIVEMATKEEDSVFKKHYLKRFPFAILNDSPIWVLYIHYIKFTDNRLGFGKKIIWEKNK